MSTSKSAQMYRNSQLNIFDMDLENIPPGCSYEDIEEYLNGYEPEEAKYTRMCTDCFDMYDKFYDLTHITIESCTHFVEPFKNETICGMHAYNDEG